MGELEAGSGSVDEDQEVYPSPQNDRKRKSLCADDDYLVVDSEKVGECSKDGDINIPKRKRKEETEAMDAETQRLLRESKKVAFPEGQLQRKSISSVLEKMRQRKLQRAQKGRSVQQSIGCSSRRPILDMKKALSGDSSLNVEVEDDFELVMVKPPNQQAVAVKQESGETTATCKFRSLQSFAALVGSVEETSRPSTPETRSEAWLGDKPSVIPSKRESLPRPPLIESQDLYSDSQLSPIRDEAPAARCADEDIPLPELDSETQTEDCSSPEDEEKENKDPTRGLESLPTVSLVRGLIDDEAEDEDEDLLADEDEEDEDGAEDLRDMLAHEVTESPGDRKCRADLHRKWLEQQDITLTDRIFSRIDSGWKKRGKKQQLPGILDEAENNDSRGSKSQASQEAGDEPIEAVISSPTSLEETGEMAKDQGLKRERSSELEEALEDANNQELDDEEEDDQFRRQRLLNESEEQSELPSVQDDETSRQIFSLINKVNVATVKPTKVTTGIHDIRPLSMVHHHSLSHVQSSFARRTVTTSVQATTRQGSGNSRSYIFGRDDSSSNPSSRFQRSETKTVNDSSPATTAGDNQYSTRISTIPRGGSSGTKGSNTKIVETTGPSLFQILKQQAADLERSVLTRDSSFSLSGSSSLSGDLSIFSVMRPSKPSRKSRG